MWNKKINSTFKLYLTSRGSIWDTTIIFPVLCKFLNLICPKHENRIQKEGQVNAKARIMKEKKKNIFKN